MSAESGRVVKQIQVQRVRPEPVIEKSFVENVTGFINEVVPQTYHNPLHYEGKERITWVRFDNCDINDLSQFRDRIECNGNAPPFLLLIGYTNGVQAWVIPANGEAVEVFSWRQGPVRTLRVLVSPIISESSVDRYSLKRPIIAICDAAGPEPQFHSVSFISLKSAKTEKPLKTIKFKNAVQDIYANKNVIVITFPEKLAVFEATTFEDLFTISTCYKCPGLSLNPIALGDQWLAFADRRLYSIHQSCGGAVMEGSSSYKSTVIHAAKSITKGLKELGETVASNFIGGQKGPALLQMQATSSSTNPGVVTIIDTQRVTGTEMNLSRGDPSGLIAHFVAHPGTPIVALQFDASGMLLATADKLGHSFHLFRIQPHPLSSAQAAVHHLYTLYRGDTTAKVMDFSFSLDARWLAVSTHRGTTHVYPITPYGGNIGMRTHKSTCVVNRLSRFQRSAGLDDSPSSGRNSPVLSSSPGVTKHAFEPSPTLAYPNPRYPPYPSPTIVKPLVQLRQPLLQNLIESIAPGPSPSHSPPSSKSSKVIGPEQIIKVSSIFGATRGWLAGSPTVPREIKKQGVDSLFVMAYHGNLIEYYLEPMAISNLPQEKVTEDTPIELEVHASAQWSLVRESTSCEILPPLPLDSPLLVPLGAHTRRSVFPAHSSENEDPEEKWMAQVEIYTHAGPPRRLWMGPQFTFKSLPSTGVLIGDQTSCEGLTDPSLALPTRTSPVNIANPRGSANFPVHIEASSLIGSQSPRLPDRLSVDSDWYDADNMNIMTKLRSDLADAMMDTPQMIPSRVEAGEASGAISPPAEDECFDLSSDMMEISCDPPGPSTPNSGMSLSSGCAGVGLLPRQQEEEHIRAVTAKLHRVAITSQATGAAECVSPFWGSRTPSLEECRAMTSSTEELASALGDRGTQKVQVSVSPFAWTPIEAPEEGETKPIYLEKPQPIERVEVPSPKAGAWEAQTSERMSEEPGTSSGPSWSAIVEGVGVMPVSEISPVGEQFQPLCVPSSRSTTTSEDDLWVGKESGRKDRRRRRKKCRSDEIEDSIPVATTLIDPLEVDADHFHTAEEFHDPLEDPGAAGVAPHLTSIKALCSSHEGDDLARALQEASSDEGSGTPAQKLRRGMTDAQPREADEMFPFRETSPSSSDDEGVSGGGLPCVRRRTTTTTIPPQHPRGEEDDDDRETTSGEDLKTTTSESDVTTSPNPRGGSSYGKGKKKKKKKK